MANRFFIAPYDKNSGQQNQLKSWLIPENAFEELTNAYVFRGRVRKRFGSNYLNDDYLGTRFRVKLDTTNGSGNVTTSVPTIGGTPIVTPAIGQQFSIGDEVFTVVALGTPANMLRSGASTLATFNTTTGAVVINGAAANTDIYYYPSLPVMGLLSMDQVSINRGMLIGFDTRFAYEHTDTGWERLDNEASGSANAARWQGGDAEFFWGTTWTGADAASKIFFVTNFNEGESNFMRRFNGTNWANFNPAITGSINLDSARILVPFKNRLLAFNTWEDNVNYPNRCRYSQIGSPLASDAFREDVPGKGSAIDASTTESIVSVEFIKDRLIVFFERSSWELVYTGNQAYPFAWQKINTELGAESTFSIIPFDTVAIGVGNVGIHACNGSVVERIDSKIPDEVFDIHNAGDGVFRVYGIRDYFIETLYWTFPDNISDEDFPYPNKVLVYNYSTDTWAFNKDTITCFGYYQPTLGVKWNSTNINWKSNILWNSGANQSLFRQVVAGNQQGYVFEVNTKKNINASVLNITNIDINDNVITVRSIKHNFRGWEDNFVYIEGITGTGNLDLLNDKIYEVIPRANDPENTFDIIYQDEDGTNISGTYSGAGRISRVSNIVIKTKEYNFYNKDGRNAYIPQIDFLVDATFGGQLQVDLFVSTSSNNLITDGEGTGTLVGTGTLDTFPYIEGTVPAPVPFEENATRVWHTCYFQGDGEVVQLQLKLNDEQMKNNMIRDSGFTLHAMCIHAMPTSYIFQ